MGDATLADSHRSGSFMCCLEEAVTLAVLLWDIGVAAIEL